MGCSVIDSTVYFDIEPFTSQTIILNDYYCSIADTVSMGSDLSSKRSNLSRYNYHISERTIR